MEGERGGIFRDSDRTKQNKDGRKKGEGSIRVANTKVYKRHAKIPRTGKLLLPVHQGIYIDSQTTV